MLEVIAMFESAAFFQHPAGGMSVLAARLLVEPYAELLFVLEGRANAEEPGADLSIDLVRSLGCDVTCVSTSLCLRAANVQPGVAIATVQQLVGELRIESRWFPRQPRNIAAIRGVLYGRNASQQS